MDRVRIPRAAWPLLAVSSGWADPSAARAYVCTIAPSKGTLERADVVSEGMPRTSARTFWQVPFFGLLGFPRRSRAHRLAVWAIAALVWVGPAVADACSCRRPPPPLAAAQAAAVVFEGRASLPMNEGMRLRTTFEVLRTFKGETGPRVDVLTMNNSAACGRRYQPGETYLVYAQQANEGLADNACSRTRRASEARMDFEALGDGLDSKMIPPAEETASDREPPRITPDEPPAVQPRGRGCSATGLAHGEPGTWMAFVLLLGVASVRRAAYGGHHSSPPRRHACRSDCSRPPRPPMNPSSPTSPDRPHARRCKRN